jgi:hypothetical protein
MTDIAAPAAGVRDLRRFWRTVQDPPSLLKRLEPAYYVFITLAIGGPFVYGTASQALADVATPHTAEVWGPALALVALLAAVRWGAVQGPVVFSVADVAQLLGAPLRRADLVLGRLVRGLLAGAAAAVVLAAIVLIGVAGNGRGIAVQRGGGFVVALALLGLLGIAGASLVQGSARWDRATRMATVPLCAVAAGLVVLGSSGTAGRHAELWSGPWGWALQPLAARAGAWPAAVALVAAAAAAAIAVALARRGRCSTERHLVRAQAREGAVAAVYSLNARYVRRSLSGAGPGRISPRGASRLPTPRSPGLAVVWRDAVALLNAPQRAVESLVLAAGGAAACLVAAEHPAALVGGSLVLYAAASRLLEPLRAETDKPSRARVLLRAPMGRVLTAHALVPGIVVLAGALLAVAGCAAAGELPADGAQVALLVVLAVVPIALCAALSSRRGGQVPPSVMAVTYGDTTGMSALILVAWIIAFPVLAAVLGAVPVSIMVAHDGAGLAQTVVALLGTSAALGWGLGLEQFAP